MTLIRDIINFMVFRSPSDEAYKMGLSQIRSAPRGNPPAKA